MNCKICGKPVSGSGNLYCSDECKAIAKENRRLKNIEKNREKSQEKFKDCVEGIDYIVCKWCGTKTTRIYGAHIKNFHAGKTSEDYKTEFPGCPLCCENDRIATTKNSGQFMKKPEYRKLFSELWKGDRNPNSKVNRSEQERKEASPWSIEFYLKRGAKTLEEAEVLLKEFTKRACSNRISNTQIEYYLNKGMSEEEAEAALKERQTTFSLEKCIAKYGEEEGRKRWEKRQEAWKAKVFNADTYIGKGTSIKADELANEIQKVFPAVLIGNKEKHIYDKQLERCYKFDIALNKKLIEFNGVFWHMKPGLHEKSDFNPVKQMFANEIWDYDERKRIVAESYGYELLVIWEDEYESDKEGTIKKCIEFLNS